MHYLILSCPINYAFKLKAEFLAVQHLRGQSGWSWDEAWHRVTAPDNVWDAHIAVHHLWYIHIVDMTDLAIGPLRR